MNDEDVYTITLDDSFDIAVDTSIYYSNISELPVDIQQKLEKIGYDQDFFNTVTF